MKNTSALYKLLRVAPDSKYEVRITLANGTTYDVDRQKSMKIYAAISDGNGPAIGCAQSARCDLVLTEQSANWPRMARFDVDVRITTESGQSKSEWLKIGRFYTDERSEDIYGNLSIVAYDAMLMMEQSWTDKIPDELLPASWPITARAWATMIQNAGLATFADLTQLDDTVAFVGLNTATTIRDVLKSIGAAHGGNWIMTLQETLKLMQYANQEAQTELNLAAQSFEKSPALAEVTRVHLESESGTVLEAGTDTGYTVQGTCEFSATEGVAELCLSRLRGYVYRPFRVGVAQLDPATEIGDSVLIDGEVYQAMSIEWSVNAWPTANAEAPYDQEVDHEYTILSPEAKNYRKTMGKVDEKLGNYVPRDEFATEIMQNEQAITLVASHTFVTQETYDAQMQVIQSQLDGNIQSWSGNEVPTLYNSPAEDWTSPTERSEHVGDLYFVNSDAGIPEAGQYYRFEENNGVYSWQALTDSALTEALNKAAAAQAAAEDAQDTADEGLATAKLKGRIWVVQPTPPYDVGDLWFNNAQSEILTCMTARTSGSFVSGDWVKRNKYTDDSAFQQFRESYNTTINAIQDQLDQKAETYYQDNDPAIEWGARPVGVAVAGIDFPGLPEGVGAGHEGDLWYNTSDNTTWYFDGSGWVQQNVPDDVFDKIDGKAQIYVTTPYPPYNVGDLWFDSAQSEIMTCMTARTSGSFVPGDWVKRNKYTDDTAVETFIEQYDADLTVQNNKIAAKVSKTSPAGQTSFKWELTDTAHAWYANNVKVMEVKSSGLSVKGAITATSGYIGTEASGFSIGASSIYNGMTSLSDTTHTGVYIGTNGIALGKGAFKVTSAGAVTASNLTLNGGSINIGDKFKVSSAGAITATSGTIGGITIGSNSIYTSGQSTYSGTGAGLYIGPSGIRLGSGFSVDVNGNITAKSGTFNGNVYAKNIQYSTTDASKGTFPGGGITPGTVRGDSGGQLAGNTINDYNIQHIGEVGALSTASLSGGVQGSLAMADVFGLATQENSTYPPYFCASRIVALTSFYSSHFYKADSSGGTNEYDLVGHYHSFTEVNGKIVIGPPNNATRQDDRSFNIADTKTYKDGVSAATVSSGEVIKADSNTFRDYSENFSFDLTDASKLYTISGTTWARLNIKNSSGTVLKKLRLQVPSGGSTVTALQSYSTATDVARGNNDYHQAAGDGDWLLTVRAKDSSGDTLYTGNVNVQFAVDWGASQGGGGGGHDTPIQLTCSYAQQDSSGYWQYRFGYSSGRTSEGWKVGDPVTFYR